MIGILEAVSSFKQRLNRRERTTQHASNVIVQQCEDLPMHQACAVDTAPDVQGRPSVTPSPPRRASRTRCWLRTVAPDERS